VILRTSICLSIAIFISSPVYAQTYRHEFVRKDGSATVCTVQVISSFSVSTECSDITASARNKGLDVAIKGYQSLNDCGNLALASKNSHPDKNYSSSVLAACLGRDSFSKRKPIDPLKVYEISCNGELTSNAINLLTPSRKIADCKNLVELALSGRIPYRTDF
jgi:hypothetical protein